MPHCLILISDAYDVLYLCDWLMCIVCMNIVLISNVSSFVKMLTIETTTNFPFGDNKVYFHFVSFFPVGVTKFCTGATTTLPN